MLLFGVFRGFTSFVSVRSDLTENARALNALGEAFDQINAAFVRVFLDLYVYHVEIT